MNSLIFVLGLMLGGFIGVSIMCMLQINRLRDNDLCEKEQ